jgi:phage-related holin
LRDIDTLPHYWLQLWAGIQWKWVAAYVAAITEFLFPGELGGWAVGVFVLVLLDFVTGVIAAKFTKVAITSAKLGRTLVKILLYCVVVIAIAIVARTLGKDVALLESWGVKSALGIMIATEAVSNLENVAKTEVFGKRFSRWIKRLIGAIDHLDSYDNEGGIK